MKNEVSLFDPFGDLFDFSTPRMDRGLLKTDIKEKESQIELFVDVPGCKKEDISLDIKNGYLTISAKHNSQNEEKAQDGKYIRRERHTGFAQRTFYVGELNEEDVVAKLENGTLEITLPKDKKPEQKKKIQIQ